MKIQQAISSILMVALLISCNNKTTEFSQQSDKALVSINDYESLTQKIKPIRAKRLISLDQFLEFQKEANTIILDARSKKMFKAKHLKGSVNLPFTDFTELNLRQIIPDTLTRILIYCNNNFKFDQFHFASKTYNPSVLTDRKIINDKKPIMLALNIPTYINLYGYGYRNIYELNDLVNVSDKRISFEGDYGMPDIGLFPGSINQ